MHARKSAFFPSLYIVQYFRVKWKHFQGFFENLSAQTPPFHVEKNRLSYIYTRIFNFLSSPKEKPALLYAGFSYTFPYIHADYLSTTFYLRNPFGLNRLCSHGSTQRKTWTVKWKSQQTKRIRRRLTKSKIAARQTKSAYRLRIKIRLNQRWKLCPVFR